ncbi:MAG TPA: MurR/RpiR family transcriptional regulator [Streptosporangiales bacterium]
MTGRHTPTVAELVRARMDTFSPAERRVARALLSGYPSSGLTTAADLARRASVSAPSVVRFATRLGLNGFADLHARLRDELAVRRVSPANRAAVGASTGATSGAVTREWLQRADLIVASANSIPPAELDAAVRVLADPSRTVVLTGGYFSHLAARYLSLQLAEIRPRVHYLTEPLQRDLSYVLDLRKRDVLVAFDVRRYEAETASLTQQVSRRGCTVIVVTDEWLSPSCAHADVVLPVITSAAPFDSLVPVLSLVESLIRPIVDAVGQAAVERMKDWETIGNPARRKLADENG